MIRSPEINVSFSGFSRLVYADVADQVRSPEVVGCRCANPRLRPAAMIAVACFGWDAPTRVCVRLGTKAPVHQTKNTEKKYGINKWIKFD